MSQSRITQHYARLLARWPVDRLRTQDRQFQNLLRQRISAPPSSSIDQSREVNAAYLLLDNAFGKEYPLSDRIMKPSSNPSHYTDIAREVDEAPDRSMFANFMKRISKLVRFR